MREESIICIKSSVKQNNRRPSFISKRWTSLRSKKEMMSFCFWSFMLLNCFPTNNRPSSWRLKNCSRWKRNSRWESKGVLLDWPLLVSHENKTNERQASVFREEEVQMISVIFREKKETRHPLWSSSGLFSSFTFILREKREWNPVNLFLSREIHKDYSLFFGEWLRVLQVFSSLSLSSMTKQWTVLKFKLLFFFSHINISRIS